MIIAIDHANPESMYLQIMGQISEQIKDGAVPPGEKLPTAGQLSESLSINRNTVLQAYRGLRDAGFIELRRGRGAIVLDQSADNDPLTSAVDDLASLASRRGISLSHLTRLLKESGLS
ncbi:GntR family transcriptional regulator [Corynebacterium sp. AOP40-9SA-29]|uniref:GntR family transcriptional regulator n=1 Tax=Corynebacterium sp. AOP40-9SA-29 TaxID=3457677 RepID=UPI004033A9F8